VNLIIPSSTLARVARALAFAAGMAMAPALVAADPALTLVRGQGGSESLEFTLEELAELPQVTIVTEN
jgi:hypothetical protein